MRKRGMSAGPECLRRPGRAVTNAWREIRTFLDGTRLRLQCRASSIVWLLAQAAALHSTDECLDVVVCVNADTVPVLKHVAPGGADASRASCLAEEIETSIRVELGVLAIYSVALKDGPTQLRFSRSTPMRTPVSSTSSRRI